MINHRYELIKLLPPNPVTVELGVAEGNFSRDIMRDWKPSLHYLVDMWESAPSFPGDAGMDQGWHNRNYNSVIEKMGPFKNYRILRGPTTAMAGSVENVTVDLVYIDACHSYECVKNDIAAWWPKLKSGGIMAFHDYEMPHYGVKMAVTEFASLNGLQINLIPEIHKQDAGAWLRKK